MRHLLVLLMLLRASPLAGNTSEASARAAALAARTSDVDCRIKNLTAVWEDVTNEFSRGDVDRIRYYLGTLPPDLHEAWSGTVTFDAIWGLNSVWHPSLDVAENQMQKMQECGACNYGFVTSNHGVRYETDRPTSLRRLMGSVCVAYSLPSCCPLLFIQY